MDEEKIRLKGAIDFTKEEVLTFDEACKRLPPRRGGKRPVKSTLFRWSTYGVNGECLETIKVGGATCTSMEALQRFFDKLTLAKQFERQQPR